MKVQIALLGNSFAKKVQVPALRWASDNGAPNQVVTLAGHDAAKAAATAAACGIPHSTGSWEECLDEDVVGSLDLVIVSTPVDLHAPMVRAVIERTSADVLCEKPFAMDGDEARELRDLARGRLALIDHQTRWSPWRRAFAREVRAGRCGAPWMGRVNMSVAAQPRIGAPYSWWYDAERGGGTLGAIASHMLDGVLHQFGERVVEVDARLMTHVPKRVDSGGVERAVTADETALLWITLESGLELTLETSLLAFGIDRDAGNGVLMELRGSKGTLRLEGETDLVFCGVDGTSTDVPLGAEPLASPTELGMPDYGFFGRCLPYYLRDVIRAIGDGETQLPGAATFDDAVHVMDVLDAARAAARTGQRQRVRGA
ncbi:MAG: Gfo/Idh/MocA family oxidoreductase [Planctomycetota bacterium]